MVISHFYQKVFVFISWLLINSILIVTSIVYSNYWYIFLVPLSISTSFNCLSVLLILVFSVKNLIYKQKEKDEAELAKKSFVYLIPCYNETEEEINNTIKSLKKQIGVEKNNKMMMIVCDGRVKGSSELTTDEILKVIFKDQITNVMYFENAYKTWTGEYNAPFTLLSTQTTIWSLGELDPDSSNAFWSTPGCKYRHPYPIGYTASRYHFGREWVMTTHLTNTEQQHIKQMMVDPIPFQISAEYSEPIAIAAEPTVMFEYICEWNHCFKGFRC